MKPDIAISGHCNDPFFYIQLKIFILHLLAPKRVKDGKVLVYWHFSLTHRSYILPTHIIVTLYDWAGDIEMRIIDGTKNDLILFLWKKKTWIGKWGSINFMLDYFTLLHSNSEINELLTIRNEFIINMSIVLWMWLLRQ